ncbi:MAG: hypothetical protein U9P63_00200, partial [Patescibacteria group bacterium]|nr:hypothetical protein [Patescibacteria group bacterium]
MEGISPKKNKAVNISSALYDIKPVTAAGDLDIEKINRISAVLDLKDSGENLIQVKEIKIQDSRFR